MSFRRTSCSQAWLLKSVFWSLRSWGRRKARVKGQLRLHTKFLGSLGLRVKHYLKKQKENCLAALWLKMWGNHAQCITGSWSTWLRPRIADCMYPASYVTGGYSRSCGSLEIDPVSSAKTKGGLCWKTCRRQSWPLRTVIITMGQVRLPVFPLEKRHHSFRQVGLCYVYLLGEGTCYQGILWTHSFV